MIDGGMNWGRDIFAVSAMESDVERDRESCSFYVTSVPSVVFDTDPEASVRVSRSMCSCTLYCTLALYRQSLRVSSELLVRTSYLHTSRVSAVCV